MKYEEFVCTPIVIILASLKFLGAEEQVSKSEGFIDNQLNREFSTERIFSSWNESWEDGDIVFSGRGNEGMGGSPGQSIPESSNFAENFPAEISKCINAHQYQITESFSSGKEIILHCFKATLILSLFRYFVVSPKSSVKLFNGVLELKKIQHCRDKSENCNGKRNRHFEKFAAAQNKKNFYVKMYKKAVEKMMNENESNVRRNLTEEEKTKQLNKIEANSQAFLSEILKSLGDEKAERAEEENIKRELSDPKLLSLFNILTKNYMLKFNVYQGVSARMKRSHNGGVTFDLEIYDPSGDEDEAEEEEEEEGDDDSNNQSSTREIRDSDGAEGKDYFDEESDEGSFIKKGKDRKKKKGIKKKVKKLKKYLPYLILPMLIQMALLPLVFKKLFFLAIKALLAGKIALILIGFNLLRNSCISNEDEYLQKIRVEHYGFGKGEEYGAWINGRSIQEPRMVEALSEEPYSKRKKLISSS